MAEQSTGWPRGRTTWIVGSIVLIVGGALVGMALGNIWIGLVLAAIFSIGWVIAYESWRGKNVGIYNRDDNGAQL